MIFISRAKRIISRLSPLLLLGACATGTKGSARPTTAGRSLEAPAHPQPLLEKAWKGSFSPDGNQIAFGAMPEGHGVGVLDLRGGARRMLTDQGKDPAWSPDGRRIAYVTAPGVGSSDAEQVWIVDIQGGSPRLLGPGGFPIWASDGKHLYVHDRKTQVIRSLSVGEPGEAQVHFEKSPSWYPALSPTADRVAFGQPDVVTIYDRRTRAKRMTWPTPGLRGVLPAWSPDGKLLAFGGYPGAPAGLWVLDVESGRAVQVAAGPFTMPAWSPDGKRLAFDRREKEGNSLWWVDRAFVDGCLARNGITAEQLGIGAGQCD